MNFPDFWTHIVLMWAFGISGILLMFIGYWLFDKLTPRIDFAKELVDNKNIAVAMMVSAVILGVALIVVATIWSPSPTPPPMSSP